MSPGPKPVDESAWAEVRAEAINAAIDKARDYAAALGGTITSIEHLADPGLLTGVAPGSSPSSRPEGTQHYAGASELHAVVELRCLATIGPISEQSRKWIDPGLVRPAAPTGVSPASGVTGSEPPFDGAGEPPRRPRPARY